MVLSTVYRDTHLRDYNQELCNNIHYDISCEKQSFLSGTLFGFYYLRGDGRCLLSSKKPPLKLPQEIWDMIYQYDIGRLLFVTRTASQLERLSINAINAALIPKQRFTVRRLTLKSDVIRINSINIGGRIYIHSLSDPTTALIQHSTILSSLKRFWKHAAIQLQLSIRISRVANQDYQDYKLNGSTYLAVKSDDVGILDIAFEFTNNGPKWILNSRASPFAQAIYKVGYANTHDFIMISDLFKCRAIIPSNRTGAEPYFYEKPFPPNNCWVDSGFLVKSALTETDNFMDPYGYMAKATYIQFAAMNSISFDIDPSRRGIYGIHMDRSENHGENSIRFSQSPKRVKFVLCVVEIGFQYPFLQFEIEGQWKPPVPHHGTVLRETLVDNAVGIWWGKTFSFTLIHIGVVVSEIKDLKNTLT